MLVSLFRSIVDLDLTIDVDLAEKRGFDDPILIPIERLSVGVPRCLPRKSATFARRIYRGRPLALHDEGRPKLVLAASTENRVY